MKIKTLAFYIFACFAINSGAAVAACSCGGEMCGANQYCYEWYEDMGNGINWNYDCMSCGNGEVPNATCDGCVTAPPNCSGYDDTCPSGVAPGKKCKEVANGCGSASNCHKYDVCDPATGDTESPVVTGDCHLEGNNNACKPNQLPCNNNFQFGAVVSGCDWNSTGTDISCTGWYTDNATASWTGSKWNVSACKCKTTNGNIAYKKCKGSYILKPTSSNNITTVNTPIKYSCEPEKYYCTQCINEGGDAPVGLCPAGIVANSSNEQCYNFNTPDSGYVVCKCAPVQADYYVASNSFSVPYPLGEPTTNCPQQCPNGMGTGGTTGAISSNGTDVCDQPSSTIIFEDMTGKFRLSSTNQCP